MPRWFACLVVAAGLIAGLGAGVRAAPITYQFQGTLPQPLDGSPTFSGTFTYDPSFVPYPGASTDDPAIRYYASAPGSALALSFRLGNLDSASLGSPTLNELVVWHSDTTDELNQNFSYATPGGTARVTLGFLNDNTLKPGGLTSTDPPPGFNLADFSGGGQLIYQDNANSRMVVGTITSLQAVPEPATWVAFVAGLAALLGLRRRSPG